MVESTNAANKPKLTKPKFVNIDQLEPGSRVTMHLKVASVKLVKSRIRNDGLQMNRAAECTVGD